MLRGHLLEGICVDVVGSQWEWGKQQCAFHFCWQFLLNTDCHVLRQRQRGKTTETECVDLLLFWLARGGTCCVAPSRNVDILICLLVFWIFPAWHSKLLMHWELTVTGFSRYWGSLCSPSPANVMLCAPCSAFTADAALALLYSRSTRGCYVVHPRIGAAWCGS